jgi:hypothetical protein
MTYTALLTDMCSVVRRTLEDFDAGTGTYAPDTVVFVYSGPCRVDSLSGAARVRVGEEAVIQSGYWVFLPTDATDVMSEDIVIVSASEDGNMVGRELTVKKNMGNFSPNTANAMRALLCEDFQEGT